MSQDRHSHLLERVARIQFRQVDPTLERSHSISSTVERNVNFWVIDLERQECKTVQAHRRGGRSLLAAHLPDTDTISFPPRNAEVQKEACLV